MFQQRDVHIPGTFNTLGGSVVTECGSKVGFNLYADTASSPRTARRSSGATWAPTRAPGTEGRKRA
jgi:hypothetical protein